MEHVEQRNIGELRDIAEADRLGSYLREVWNRRSYMTYVARSELRSRQALTVLGSFWHLLNPILQISVFYLIFGLLLKTTRGVDNFILFITVGLFTFEYSRSATIAGAKSIISNVGLLKAIKFPRVILPMTSTLTEALASVSSFAVIFGVALLTGQPFRWQWALLFALFAVQLVFNFGAAMVAARTTTHFR